MIHLNQKKLFSWMAGFTAVFILLLLVPVKGHCFSFIAHRVDMEDGPEESKRAFELAKSKQYTAVEVDLTETLDHTFLLSHDDTTNRLFGEEMNVVNLTRDTYQDYQFYMNEDYTGEPLYLLTLEDALYYSKIYNFKLYIHIKNIDTSAKSGCVKRMLKLIKSYGMLKRVVIYSHYKKHIKALTKQIKKLKLKGVKLGYCSNALTEEGYKYAYRYAKKHGLKYVMLNYGDSEYDLQGHMASVNLIKKFHKAKIKVVGYPINTAEDIQKLYLQGYDGAFCNKKLF